MTTFKETLNQYIQAQASASESSQDKLGRKFDSDKLEYGLYPHIALQETVRVLTFGAKKYARDNWKYVDDADRRYFDAAMRHLWAWKAGEQNDPETGVNHLAHAACCIAFLLHLDEIKGT